RFDRSTNFFAESNRYPDRYQGMDAPRAAAKREYHSSRLREMESASAQARNRAGRVVPWSAQYVARFPAAANTLQRCHRQQSLVGGAGSLAGYTRVLHFEGSGVEHDAITESNLGWPRSNGPCRHSRPHRSEERR